MILRAGDRGEGVVTVQRLLGVASDGVFGPATDEAVRAFQRGAGLAPDGVVGPATMRALLNGTKRITEQDMQQAATALDVDLASIKAVTTVESRGSGFLSDGRPAILFERHIMRRQLAKTGRDADLLARYMPDIINATPGGYKGGKAEHDRLYLARQIDPSCAIESASWGLFQIMGFHWGLLGYESAADFEARMTRSEGEQLGAFVRFVKADAGLHSALRRRDWTDFARRYNGPAFAKNQYDTKLAEAYRRVA